MSDSLSVVALVNDPPTAWEQWRIVRPFHRMRQVGLDAHVYSRDAQNIVTDPESTVLVLPRMTGTDPETIDRYLDGWRPRVKAIVYETDDDVFSPAMTEHLIASDFMQGQTVEQHDHARMMAQQFMRACDGVTVSSEPLAALARQITDKPVIVVPNALDVRWFRSAMSQRPPWANVLTIGWAGGRRPERDIAPMAEAWGRIARRYPNVHFVVCAPVVPDVIYRHVEDDSRIIRQPWLDWENYPLAYQVNIGCCAVADNAFTRAKTPIKAWEFALAGAAVVATLTVYEDCVGGIFHGSSATTADEWEVQLADMIENEDIRTSTNSLLQEHIQEDHSLDTQLFRWSDAYHIISETKVGVLV